MKSTLDDSRIDERTEIRPEYEALAQDEIKDAVGRLEKSFDASRAAISQTLEEGRISAERLLRRGRDTAEGYLDDATYQVKRNPGTAVALAFGAGAIAGALFGLVAPQVAKKRKA